jgi:RNA polymerase sigma factor (sigma-70 family)
MEGQPTIGHLPATTSASREDASFEAFFTSASGRLFRALLLMTGSRHEAEDLTQAAFLRLLERWGSLDHGEGLEGYLFRTAMNAHRSYLRRARVAAKRALAPGRADPDPFEQVAEHEQAVRLLLALTPRQRAAIVLTGIQGFDYRQAGVVLQVKESTVRALVAQARARLREEAHSDDA